MLPRAPERLTPRCFLWSLWQVIFGTWSELLILSNELYWAHRHWLGSCSHSLARCCLLACRSLTRWPSESGVCCEQQSVGLRLFDLLKQRWDVCSQTLWEIMYYGAFFPLWWQTHLRWCSEWSIKAPTLALSVTCWPSTGGPTPDFRARLTDLWQRGFAS